MARVHGTELLALAPSESWRLLNDPEALGAAIPGCSGFERDAGYRYRTSITVAVGAVRSVYAGTVEYRDVVQPERCTIHVQGRGDKGAIEGHGRVALAARDGGTEVSYDGTFKITGPVAAVGQRLVPAISRKMIVDTLRNLERRGLAAEPGATASRRMSRFWHPFSNMGAVANGEVVLVSGDGCELEDRDGRRYLDAAAALWYCNVGYGRREIAEAIAEQAARLSACSCFDVYASDRTLELADRIAEVSPVDGAVVFFTSGGSDSIDTAAKVARRYWAELGRPEKSVVISREGSYHGMHAYGTSLAGIAANRERFGTLVPDTAVVPAFDVDALAAAIDDTGSDRIAAFFAEPVMAAGGVHPPPDGYLRAAAELCRERDVLFVADEVVTGFGRTGRMFGSERYGIRPDALVLAKGITSGYLPLGAVVFSERIAEPFWRPAGDTFLRHGYTYSGHATACAAALVNLDIIDRERLVERVASLEPVLRSALEPLAELEQVSEVRSLGLVAAVQLAPEAVGQAPRLPDETVQRCRGLGLLTRRLAGDALQVSPPFVISDGQIERIATVMRDGITAAWSKARLSSNE